MIVLKKEEASNIMVGQKTFGEEENNPLASNLLMKPDVIKIQTTPTTTANQRTKNDWLDRL
jgi:hypothetical protein